MNGFIIFLLTLFIALCSALAVLQIAGIIIIIRCSHAGDHEQLQKIRGRRRLLHVLTFWWYIIYWKTRVRRARHRNDIEQGRVPSPVPEEESQELRHVSPRPVDDDEIFVIGDGEEDVFSPLPSTPRSSSEVLEKLRREAVHAVDDDGNVWV